MNTHEGAAPALIPLGTRPAVPTGGTTHDTDHVLDKKGRPR